MPDVSFALTRACRDVLLGQDSLVELSRRATGTLERIRAERSMQVDAGGLVLQRQWDQQVWWTFAGTRANASLVAGLDRLGISATAAAEAVRSEIFGADAIRALSAVLEQAQAAGMPMCEVDQQAVEGLKFSAALPADLAMRTLAERGSDLLHARVHRHPGGRAICVMRTSGVRSFAPGRHLEPSMHIESVTATGGSVRLNKTVIA